MAITSSTASAIATGSYGSKSRAASPQIRSRTWSWCSVWRGAQSTTASCATWPSSPEAVRVGVGGAEERVHQRAPLLLVRVTGKSFVPAVVGGQERRVAVSTTRMRIGRRDEAIYTRAVIVIVVLFWVSLAVLAWTHVLYPLLAIGLARVVPRPVHDADVEPTVAVIVAAYNEESVIAGRIENLLALDYPRETLIQIVVTSDASTIGPRRSRSQYPGVKVISNPRGGKVAAQDRAVRQTESEIVAFSDANSHLGAATRCDVLVDRSPIRTWPTSAVSCGCSPRTARTRRASTGATSSVCATPSRDLGSVTGGNGSIYAVRRSDYVEVDSRFGHDLSLPYLMVQHGRRAVYEPAARSRARRRRPRTRPSIAGRCGCSSIAG